MLIRLFLFFALSPLFCDPIGFFLPPKGWDCVKSKQLSESIEVGFLKNGIFRIPASINLSKVRVSVSFKEYLRSVKNRHEKEMKVEWRDLGNFSCQAGTGRLAEIRSSSSFGELKMLQGIVLQDGWAFTLTCAASKEDFPEERATFLTVLRSLAVFPDLFSAISDERRKESLKEIYDSFKFCSDDERPVCWKNLPKILAEYEDLGAYWLFLALKEGRGRIFSEL